MVLGTVVAAYTLLLFAVTVLLWVFWLTTKPRQTALAWWAMAYSTLVVATTAFTLQPRLPLPLYIFLFNAFIHAFFLVLIQGVNVIRGRKPRLRPLVFVAAVALAWNTWFFYVDPAFVPRAIQYSIFSATFATAFGVTLIRASFPERSATVVLSILAFFVAALQVLRVSLIVIEGYPAGIQVGTSWDSWIQAGVMLAVSLIAISLIYFVALRLNSALAVAASDREFLLREMTHRIKNDLAVVDSLIGLEESATDDPGLAMRFSSIRERIRCIAAAHDLFSRHGGQIGRIDTAAYLEVVSRGLPSYPWISIETEFESLEMPFSLALPLGILLNELATNAVKHAFPQKRQGRLRLTLTSESGMGLLTVEDDGVGTLWPPAREGLGTQIVEQMVGNLRGKLLFDGATGARFRISFPLES